MACDVPVAQLALDSRVAPLIGQLQALYAEMDRQYDKAAGHYGFSCTGCEDNCCMTRFYHHTFLEFIFLRKGVAGLAQGVCTAARQRAEQYAEALRQIQAKDKDAPFRMMCPLNRDGWCLVYEFRPMICRLHGIPHELTPPGRPRVVFSQGCGAFDRRCGHLPYVPFDRTPYYTRMSRLESDLRKALGIAEKSKKTVAHMLIHDKVRVHEVS